MVGFKPNVSYSNPIEKIEQIGTYDPSTFWDKLEDFGNWIGDTFFGGSHATNEANMQMNSENIAFQKQENEITRMREDNAVQRAAADMSAAGLSKTLAAGSPASAQALTAPSNSNAMQKNMAGLNMIDAVQNIIFKKKEADRAEKLNDAQVENIAADTAGKTISNEFLRDKLTAEIALATASTEQSKALASYYQNQAKISKITGDNLQRQIDSDIAYKTQLKLESASHLVLNTIDAEKKRIEIDKLAEEIKTEILNQDYIKGMTDKQKEEVALLIKNQAKVSLEMNVINHDLGVAKMWGYPVGQYPASLWGQLERMGKGVSEVQQSNAEFAKNQFIKTGHGLQNLFKGLGNFYKGETDFIQSGGLLEALRSIFNFSPLNWML